MAPVLPGGNVGPTVPELLIPGAARQVDFYRDSSSVFTNLD